MRSRHGAPAGRPATVPLLTQNLGARQSARLAADPSRRGSTYECPSRRCPAVTPGSDSEEKDQSSLLSIFTEVVS